MFKLNLTDFEELNTLLDSANTLCINGIISDVDVLPDLKKVVAKLKEVIKRGKIDANFC
jgi:hypothetical protein